MNAFDSAVNAMHGTSEKTMSGRLHEEGVSSHPKLCVPMTPMSCAPSLPSPSSVPPSQEAYLKSTSETWTGGVHEPQCGPTDRISMLSSSGASMTSTDSPFGFPDTFALLGVPTDIEDVVREGEMSAWAEARSACSLLVPYVEAGRFGVLSFAQAASALRLATHIFRCVRYAFVERMSSREFQSMASKFASSSKKSSENDSDVPCSAKNGRHVAEENGKNTPSNEAVETPVELSASTSSLSISSLSSRQCPSPSLPTSMSENLELTKPLLKVNSSAPSGSALDRIPEDVFGAASILTPVQSGPQRHRKNSHLLPETSHSSVTSSPSSNISPSTRDTKKMLPPVSALLRVASGFMVNSKPMTDSSFSSSMSQPASPVESFSSTSVQDSSDYDSSLEFPAKRAKRDQSKFISSISGEGPSSVRANSRNDDRSCVACGKTSTPEWRRGPSGSKTLCNACGLFFAKLQRRKKPLSPIIVRRYYAVIRLIKDSGMDELLSQILPCSFRLDGSEMMEAATMESDSPGDFFSSDDSGPEGDRDTLPNLEVDE